MKFPFELSIESSSIMKVQVVRTEWKPRGEVIGPTVFDPKKLIQTFNYGEPEKLDGVTGYKLRNLPTLDDEYPAEERVVVVDPQGMIFADNATVHGWREFSPGPFSLNYRLLGGKEKMMGPLEKTDEEVIVAPMMADHYQAADRLHVSTRMERKLNVGGFKLPWI